MGEGAEKVQCKNCTNTIAGTISGRAGDRLYPARDVAKCLRASSGLAHSGTPMIEFAAVEERMYYLRHAGFASLAAGCRPQLASPTDCRRKSSHGRKQSCKGPLVGASIQLCKFAWTIISQGPQLVAAGAGDFSFATSSCA